MGRNITNQPYYSYGQVGQNFFEGNSTTTFMGPGAPATSYAGFVFIESNHPLKLNDHALGHLLALTLNHHRGTLRGN